jgi:hypothetical protein
VTTMDKELSKRMREARKEHERKLAQEVEDGKATVETFWMIDRTN